MELHLKYLKHKNEEIKGRYTQYTRYPMITASCSLIRTSEKLLSYLSQQNSKLPCSFLSRTSTSNIRLLYEARCFCIIYEHEALLLESFFYHDTSNEIFCLNAFFALGYSLFFSCYSREMFYFPNVLQQKNTYTCSDCLETSSLME